LRYAHGFLADIEMAETADFSEAVRLGTFLFKADGSAPSDERYSPVCRIFVDLSCRLFGAIKYAGATCWRVLGAAVALGRLATHLVDALI